ncbi:MAG: flagellar basal body L-ring protein FlgH [Acidobacteriaceae bacterium]
MNRLKLAGVIGISCLLVSAAKAKVGRASDDLAHSSDARARFLQRVHDVSGTQAASVLTVGSLWRSDGAFASLATDSKAHAAGDVITITIAESTTASSTGNLTGSRKGSASAQISQLGGKLKPSNALNNLYSATTAADLQAQGAQASSNVLLSVMTGYVLEALPNGMLAIEGVRNLDIDHQKQTVTVRGLIRSIDISSGNTIPSTAIANLEIEVKGKGAVSDFTHPLNPVVRFVLRWLGI